MGANLCNISTSTKDLTFCLDVANSSSARVFKKKDPSSWTAASASEDNEWQSIGYGNGKFVAVAKTGTNRIMYSSDGINWTAQEATSASSWRDVTYGNGKFVAVGGATVMYASDSDLTTWTSADAAESNSWRGIVYGNGKFVAVSSNGTNRIGYASDSDLTTWTALAAAEDNAWRSVTYGNGKFVAVAAGGTNRVMYASDSDVTSWTAVAAAEDNSWRDVIYGNGKFVAVSADGTNRVMYSSDGINWSNSGLSGVPTNAWRSVTYGNGKFVAVSGTNVVIYSGDGINWTTASATEDNSWQGITSGNGKFVAVSETGTNRVMYSSMYEYFLNDLSKTNAPGVLSFDQNLTSFQSPYVELNMNGIKDYYKVSGGTLIADGNLMEALTFFGLNPYTIEFWVNRYDGYLILDAGDYTGNWFTDPRIVIGWGYDRKLLYRNYGNIEFLFGGPENNVTVTDEVWSGWMHYVITREGTGSNECKLYHNGSLLSQGTDSSNHSNTDLPKVPVLFNTYTWAVYPGTVPNSSYPFKGKFGLFKIYNGNALSATEVLQNYNATKRRFGL